MSFHYLVTFEPKHMVPHIIYKIGFIYSYFNKTSLQTSIWENTLGTLGSQGVFLQGTHPK